VTIAVWVSSDELEMSSNDVHQSNEQQEIKMDHIMKKILTVRTFEIFNA